MRSFMALVLIVFGTALASASYAQSADNYPSRPVTIIIAFPPGGGTDGDARLFSQKLTENTRQQFLVDYKPGAGSTLGTAYVAKAKPDGYTVLMASTSFPIAPAMYPNLPYDVVTDFEPVALLTKRPSLLVVNPALPIRTVKEYIAYARANPGKLNFGTTGSGGAVHLAGAFLHNLTDTKATFVHYKGNSQMIFDLVSGRLDAVISIPQSLMPNIKAGKIRLIASTGFEHSKLLGNTPTVAESGVPDYDYSGGVGILAPRATPAPIVNKLSAEFHKASLAPEVFQKLADDGNVLNGSSTPEVYRKAIITEVTRWKKVVRDNNIKLEE